MLPLVKGFWSADIWNVLAKIGNEGLKPRKGLIPVQPFFAIGPD
jgi:hypothetical protein